MKIFKTFFSSSGCLLRKRKRQDSIPDFSSAPCLLAEVASLVDALVRMYDELDEVLLVSKALSISDSILL